jgi:hypothetical protein
MLVPPVAAISAPAPAPLALPPGQPTPPSLLGVLKAALPSLLSRKLIVAITTKGSILLIAWLSTRVPPEVAVRLIEFVVPALTATGLGHMAAQGWVDRHEVTQPNGADVDIQAEVRAGIEAGLAAAKAEPIALAAAAAPVTAR